MRVVVAQDAPDAYKLAADAILTQVTKNPSSCLGLATGGTAEGIYPYIVQAHREKSVDFSNVRTFNLDEYHGLSQGNPQSYINSMNRWLFDHINMKRENIHIASGVGNAEESVEKFKKELKEFGPIDLQLLGVGKNGHIGFNEPNSFLNAEVHLQTLSNDTIKNNARFFKNEQEVPRTAITMGMGDILKARKILLVATENKQNAIRMLFTNDHVCPEIPVTFLKLHPDVTVIIDKALAIKAGLQNEIEKNILCEEL